MIIYSGHTKLQDGGKQNAITIEKLEAKPKGGGSCSLMLLP